VRFTVNNREFEQTLNAALDKSRLSAERASVEGARKGAVRILGTAQESIQRSPGGGAIRSRGDTASRPGDPPRTDTGRLAQAGRVDPQANGADVVFGVGYAVHLEFGTRHIAPRPFLTPALAKESGTTAQEAAKILRGLMRAG
jgi:hypothetical protein